MALELQLRKDPIECMRKVVCEAKQEEQVLEVKLSEAMPDVGRVLTTWGQVILRSKEWRGNGAGISGGVMLWVLYIPEEGDQPQIVEGWAPFQIRWDFPKTQADGGMMVSCYLSGADARAVSPRKMMVRACVSAFMEAYEPVKVDVCVPVDMPEDVCLLKHRYPVCIPKETGEKTFIMEETFGISCPGAEPFRLLHYGFLPHSTEEKVMADKVVFRTEAVAYGLLESSEGNLCPFQQKVSISQYSDLQGEYYGDTWARVEPTVTDLELTMEDGQLHLKAKVVVQYVIYERLLVEVLADAYCPGRTTDLAFGKLILPAVLDQRQTVLTPRSCKTMPVGKLVDVSIWVMPPAQRKWEQGDCVQQQGSFQVLYYDQEGLLKADVIPWEEEWRLDVSDQAQMIAKAVVSEIPFGESTLEEIQLQGKVGLEAITLSSSGIPMLESIKIGETESEEREKPSLILRRVGDNSLWDIAKECGSTEQAIMQANKLEGDPAPDQILLIPVR